jgi:hypothetical protein
MPSVSFTYGAFIHDAGDLDDYITVTSRRDPTHDRQSVGDVDITASGRRIWTSGPGITETFSVSFRTRTLAVRKWVYDIAESGDLVLYRDKRGRREFAVLRSVSVSDLNSDLYDISMTVVPVDHTPIAVDLGA